MDNTESQDLNPLWGPDSGLKELRGRVFVKCIFLQGHGAQGQPGPQHHVFRGSFPHLIREVFPSLILRDSLSLFFFSFFVKAKRDFLLAGGVAVSPALVGSDGMKGSTEAWGPGGLWLVPEPPRARPPAPPSSSWASGPCRPMTHDRGPDTLTCRPPWGAEDP